MIANIVGKGPSLQYLKRRHFLHPGIVITINEAIWPVQQMELDMPIFSLQKDGYDDHMVRPREGAVLILQNEYSENWFKEFPLRIIVDPIANLGFDAKETMSTRMAIKIAGLLGCNDMNMLCFDSLVNGDLRTYDPIVEVAGMTGASEHYAAFIDRILKDLEAYKHRIVIPEYEK